MKAILAILAAVLLMMPAALAAGGDKAIGGQIGVEDFPLKVWQCGGRVLKDEDVQPWRTSGDGDELIERNNNYLFEGERYAVDVLVMDKNKIDEAVVDVIFKGGIGDLNLNCVPTTNDCISECNAMIDEEHITTFDPLTMQMYTCTIVVPDSGTAYGEYGLTVQAVDSDGTKTAEYDETSMWFLNPLIRLDVTGGLTNFDGARPGTSKYSNVQVKNGAEGGVILDMFILGEDWYSPDPAQARCNNNGVLLNKLPLSAFRYYVENGAYNSRQDAQKDDNNYDPAITRAKDSEGYLNIHKKLNSGFEESMFNEAEILQANPLYGTQYVGGQYWLANLLYPGSAGMTLTVRLNLPNPCYGTFANSNAFHIYGEAV